MLIERKPPLDVDLKYVTQGTVFSGVLTSEVSPNTRIAGVWLRTVTGVVRLDCNGPDGAGREYKVGGNQCYIAQVSNYVAHNKAKLVLSE